MVIIPLLFFDCPCGSQCGFTSYPVAAWGLVGQLGLCSSPPSTGKDGETPGFQTWWLQLVRKLNSASSSPRSNQRTQSLSGMTGVQLRVLMGCFSYSQHLSRFCLQSRGLTCANLWAGSEWSRGSGIHSAILFVSSLRLSIFIPCQVCKGTYHRLQLISFVLAWK